MILFSKIYDFRSKSNSPPKKKKELSTFIRGFEHGKKSGIPEKGSFSLFIATVQNSRQEGGREGGGLLPTTGRDSRGRRRRRRNWFSSFLPLIYCDL